MHPSKLTAIAAAITLTLSTQHAARADVAPRLQPSQVLVIYDSRTPDSLAVAEHYAGSEAVPGGVGGIIAARGGVRTLDLAQTGVPLLSGSDLTRSQFNAGLRDPIRQHLIDTALDKTIRCLVLVKGTPHRLQDFDDWTDPDIPSSSPVGDNPNGLLAQLVGADADAASVDSELTLLWRHELDTEAGGPLDSLADNPLRNPYHTSHRPINAFSNANNRASMKSFAVVGGGFIQEPDPEAGDDERFTAGDMLLVCRLDGTSVDGVRAMIDRARNIAYDVNAHALLFDESASNGTQSEPGGGELDNSDGPLNAGDDYELARDALIDDGRFDPSLIRYDGNPGSANFFIGPIPVNASGGVMITDPVILLASEGRNHGGGAASQDRYGESFIYAPGAIFTSIESYNGRAFNALGTLFQQEQVGDVIAAGATFGIGFVYEPLSNTVADTAFLVQNFVLGDLTWAEAAYSSLPTISWMAIVIGDPLAVPRRTSEDINGDGWVDADDLYAWEASPADLNRDGIADNNDRLAILRHIRASDVLNPGGL